MEKQLNVPSLLYSIIDEISCFFGKSYQLHYMVISHIYIYIVFMLLPKYFFFKSNFRTN